MNSALRPHKLAWRATASLVVLGALIAACDFFSLGGACMDWLVWGSAPGSGDPGGLMTGVERVRVLLTVDVSERAARSRLGPAIRSSASVDFAAWPLVPGAPERLEDANGVIASITIEGGGPTVPGAYHRTELPSALADCPANASCHREFIATFAITADPTPRTFRWSAGVTARVGEEVCAPMLVSDVTISATFIDRVGGVPVGDAGAPELPDGG